ncbi:hypothetical protein H0H87_007543 [Tephrocybe sp. NHM501043]|nr:hypothetical protein H0H87_007543 [Tephrocybe sp. NHM501043]
MSTSYVLLQFGDDPFNNVFDDLEGRRAFTVYGHRLDLNFRPSDSSPANSAHRSRYFTSQNGKDYKWRISPSRMELFDGRTTLAIWELSHPDDDFHARLTIKPPGLPVVTEIVTTLAMNRMAQELQWERP